MFFGQWHAVGTNQNRIRWYDLHLASCSSFAHAIVSLHSIVAGMLGLLVLSNGGEACFTQSDVFLTEILCDHLGVRLSREWLSSEWLSLWLGLLK